MVIVSPCVHLSCLSDSEAMESTDSHVDDLLPAQTLDDGRLTDVLIWTMTKPEVIPLAPGPNKAGLGKGKRELSAALDLTDPDTVQLFDVVRDAAAFATTAT